MWLSKSGCNYETIRTLKAAIVDLVTKINEDNPRLSRKDVEKLEILNCAFQPQSFIDSKYMDENNYADLRLLCQSLKRVWAGKEFKQLIEIVDDTLEALYQVEYGDKLEVRKNESLQQLWNSAFQRLKNKVQAIDKITLDKIIKELFSDFFASCAGEHLISAPVGYYRCNLDKDIENENASSLHKIFTLTVIGTIFGILCAVNPIMWCIAITDGMQQYVDEDEAFTKLKDKSPVTHIMSGGSPKKL